MRKYKRIYLGVFHAFSMRLCLLVHITTIQNYTLLLLLVFCYSFTIMVKVSLLVALIDALNFARILLLASIAHAIMALKVMRI